MAPTINKERNIAIIDMGSNSVRLVIYYINSTGATYKIDDLKRSLRLSSHLDKKGNLSAEGISITLQCLAQFKQLCESRSATHIVGVATAALRQAKNQKAVVQKIELETGIKFRILSGEEEAHYGYLAVRSSIDMEEAIIIDIGGGSTEISWMKDRKRQASVSLPIGAVNLTNKYFVEGSKMSRKDMKGFISDVELQLSNVKWLQGLNCPVIALGGTARSMAAIHQAKRRYSFDSIHNYKMDTYDIALIYHMLRRTPAANRSEIIGLSDGREDIIFAGVALYKVIMNYIDVEEFRISTYGIREGVCQEIIYNKTTQTEDEDIIVMHMKRFAHYYNINEQHAEQVVKLCGQLYEQLDKHNLLVKDESAKKVLLLSGFLYDIGRAVNIFGSQNHTYYLLSNVNLPGLNHRERILVALIASYKKTKIMRQRLMVHDDILKDEDETMVKQLGLVLLLATALDRTASSQVKQIKIEKSNDNYNFICRLKNSNSIELDEAKLVLRKLKKYFNISATIQQLKI